MNQEISWVKFHDKIKNRFKDTFPKHWWGDDLDVRFYVLKKLSQIRDKKILDIGCSFGLMLSFLDKSNQLYGIDIDKCCIEKAKELNPDATFCCGTMEQLPYDDSSFDVIMMMAVIPYYDFKIKSDKDDFINKTLNQIKRVLKSDGIIYIVTPNGDSVHYKGSTKISYQELLQILNRHNLSFSMQGWNSMSPILAGRMFEKVNKRYRFIPPKILCKYEAVWTYLCKRMKDNIQNAKYFYIEAKK